MKIVYCIGGTYNSGGMERVLANKANYLVDRGYDVTIVTTEQQHRLSFFTLDKRIKNFDLGINYEANNGKSFINKVIQYPIKQFKHRNKLEQLLKTLKPDIVISMFGNEANFLYKIKDGSKKILEIHFSRFKRLQYGRKGLWRWADVWRSKNEVNIVNHYDRFVVLTKEDGGYWGEMANLQVIPNARTFVEMTPAKLENHEVVAVGRYNYQKGYDRLISAWKIVHDSFPTWKLRVVGDGELREEMEAKIKQLGLQNSIILGRATKDIQSIYRNASMLVLSSHYEGLPMVLLEAQAMGLPIVSFDCKCGPKDVVADGINGYLVNNGDITGLAEKMMTLMENEELRISFGKNAFINSRCFDEDVIMKEWTTLFNEVING